MFRMKTAMAALYALILSIGLATAVPPVEAQNQTGLVNVAVGDITTGDILSNNQVPVGVAANVAANVCGLTAQVGVIAQQVSRTGSFRCENNQTLKFVQITKQ
jgi:class 3 adenylate cyclase